MTDLPLVAIGSMKVDNAREVVMAGADCVCSSHRHCICRRPCPSHSEIGGRSACRKARTEGIEALMSGTQEHEKRAI